jgi:hypothetical protein
MAVDGVEPLVKAPALADASCRLFGGVHPRPTFLYVNVTAPTDELRWRKAEIRLDDPALVEAIVAAYPRLVPPPG